MRYSRLVCLLTLVLLAAGAAGAAEPTVTRISVNGQTRIYRTYGWVTEPEIFAPIARELQAHGLKNDWQLEQEHVSLEWQGAVTRWRVTRDREAVGAGGPRSGETEQAEALEIDNTLYLPVRAAAALMGGSVTWNAPRRTLFVQIGGAAAAGRPDTGTGGTPVVTRLEWSEGAAGLALEVEASAPVRASVLELQNPSRLVIDFSPAAFRLAGVLEPRGAVRRIRTGQFKEDVARVVLELSGARLTGTGLPRTPQSRFTIRLTGNTVAAAQSGAGARRAPLRRPGQLASRGGFGGRDVDRIKAALAAGEGLLRGKVICIDAGHGGRDPGAAGADGLREKDLTLLMAFEAARALEEAGATVLLTRSDDTYLSLEDRWGMANDQGVDLFISIHCNAMPRRNMASGQQTYYCNLFSRDLARALHPQIVGVMGGPDGGIRQRRFAVVRHTQMPAVLLEIAFINHDGDALKLADPGYHRAVGEAIRDGVIRYYGE